jgi:hypothetical protein
MGENLAVCPTGMPGEAVQRTKDGSLVWNYDRFQFTFDNDACLSNGIYPTLNSVNQVDFGPLSAGVLANTVSFFFTETPNQTIECDIRFNSTVNWYTGIERPSATQFDWWSVATHELGHCLGLDHEDTIFPLPVMQTTLLAGAVMRQLTADDVAGRNRIYDPPRSTPVETPVTPAPAPAPVTSTPTTTSSGGSGGGGGCSLVSHGPIDTVAMYSALGNLFLPLAVVMALRIWSWRRAATVRRR